MSVMFLPLRLIPLPVQCVVMSSVLDLAFSRDANLNEHLDGLNHKVFRIHVTDTNVVMFLGFKSGRTWVHADHADEADVRIEATMAGFARMCFAKEDPDDLVFQQVLKLSGDSEAMLRFKKLLAAADLDWERELRAIFGDFFGARVAKAAHALVAAEAKVSATSKDMLQDCLKNMQTPNQQRLQAWQAGVEQLSHQVTKLKGKTTRLEHRSDALQASESSQKT